MREFSRQITMSSSLTILFVAFFAGLWRYQFWKALWDPGLQRLLGIFQTQRATSTDLSMPSGNRNVHDRQGP